ncbi:MAG: mandelate racemase/muconate lactonizing protein [Acidobacteria bacterium]|nr:mandelate racemase/muconate lactonizing protein [Acidobacteriota bacterium]
MKIVEIETIPIRVPIRPQLAIRAARGSHVVSPFLLVRIHTGAGITGLGEVSCTPRWSGEDQFTAGHFIREYLAPLWIGEDARDIERLTSKLRLGVAGNSFTKAALEMALWDIAGKAEGVPVYRLLGGAVREAVPLKWSISGVEPERARGIASWALEQGFTAMKVKVGIDPVQDLARVRAVRQAIGPGLKLGVDANGAWDVDQASCMIERLSEFDIAFAEQPVGPEDVEWMAEVRRRVRVPIVADESVYTEHDARALARAGAADVLSVYIGKSGGIGPARRITASGLPCTIGSNLELGIASAAMIHLAVATPAVQAETWPCDIIGPLFYEDEILTEPLEIAGGLARAPQRPGLGVELDAEKVARYRV